MNENCNQLGSGHTASAGFREPSQGYGDSCAAPTQAGGQLGAMSNEGRRAMSFSRALERMKGGDRIARGGWNGPNQFVVLNLGSDPSAPHERAGYLSGISSGLFGQGDSGSTRRMPYAVIRTADGASVPWVPSQTDMLAEDWRQV